MTYVMTAMWRAREGEEDHVREVLRKVAAMSRQEPGCRMFLAHRSPEDPRTFYLYEQFDDEAAFTAHTEADHFKELVLGDIIPRLEGRERAAFELMD